MSTRFYRLYQRGGPQRRVFLPNFWLKLVKPTHELPPNIVQFACSMEMTKHDVKNYLEKIYNINVVKVNTRIAAGKTRQDPVKAYVVKDDDVKYAYITLAREEKFVFPDLYASKDATEHKEQEDKTMKIAKQQYKEFAEKNKDRPGIPSWFNI